MAIPLRVLIVEDSENDTLLLVKELRRGGYEATHERVDSLVSMKAALDKQPWDIVLSDYSMPDFTGTDALLLLREWDPDTPFIYVSGTIGEDMAVAAMKAGANDYIIKDNLKRLIPAVRRELAEAQTRRERKRLQEERDRLFEETRRNLDRIRALHEIDLAITSTLDLRTVMDVLLEKLELFLPLPAATTVRLLNRGTGEVEPVACRNIDDKKWKALGGSPLGGRSYKVYATKTPLIISDLRESREQAGRLDFYLEQGLVSYAGVPLIAKGEALGVLSFYTREEHKFTEEEIEFLRTLAGQAAIAIHNAQLHEGIKKQAEELDRANKVKDAFLSVMSHELRTPLTVVTGYAGMIKDRLLGEINPQQEVALEKVLTRSGDLLAVVNNILLATVLETEKIKGERQKVVLGEFFTQLSSNYGTPVKKQLTLNWDCSSPSMVIHTDGAKLKQILQNLIDNAIKFTEKGTVTTSARIRQQAEGRQEDFGELSRAATGNSLKFSRLPPHASEGWVEFKVADTGVGIPKEHLPVIFERFRQVDNSETRLYGGVGLGLYIVKKFTVLLGGTIKVESEPGTGSTFTVILPYQRVQ